MWQEVQSAEKRKSTTRPQGLPGARSSNLMAEDAEQTIKKRKPLRSSPQKTTMVRAGRPIHSAELIRGEAVLRALQFRCPHTEKELARVETPRAAYGLAM